MTYNWTDEKIELLRQCRSKGWSFSDCCEEIMRKFGGYLTRNAVIGKSTRVGIKGPQKSEAYQRRDKPKRVRSRKEKVLTPRVINPEPEPIASSLDPVEIPTEQRKQILELRFEDCRWPYGDPGTADFFFCGAPIQSGCSYCAFHRRVSVGRDITPLTVEEIDRRQAQGRRMADRNNRKAA